MLSFIQTNRLALQPARLFLGISISDHIDKLQITSAGWTVTLTAKSRNITDSIQRAVFNLNAVWCYSLCCMYGCSLWSQSAWRLLMQDANGNAVLSVTLILFHLVSFSIIHWRCSCRSFFLPETRGKVTSGRPVLSSSYSIYSEMSSRLLSGTARCFMPPMRGCRCTYKPERRHLSTRRTSLIWENKGSK